MSKEADKFWENLDEQLLEEEQALEEFRGYLNGLAIEEAESALNGLREHLKEREHLAVDELVMGWERRLLGADNPDNPHGMRD